MNGCLAFVLVSSIGAVVIALPFLAPTILPLIGFGILGPLAGGLAAAAQSFRGNVDGGSIFSTLQSMGMKSS